MITPLRTTTVCTTAVSYKIVEDSLGELDG